MAKTILVALMGPEPDHILNGQRSEGARGAMVRRCGAKERGERWCGTKERGGDGATVQYEGATVRR